MINMNLIDKLKYEDLPEFSVYRDIWVSIGEDAFKKLITDFAGINVYFTKINSFDKLILRVIKEDNITDVRVVSKLTNLSRRTARNYIKLAFPEKVSKNDTDNKLILPKKQNKNIKINTDIDVLKDFY